VADLRRLAAGAVLAAVTLSGCASPDLPAEGLVGSEISPAWPVPETQLEADDGSSYAFDASTDKPVTLVFFGYTNCPDICSMVMANITQALTRVGEDAAAKVDVVFVSTDPQRDKKHVLTRYLGAFDDSYVGVRGTMAEITEVAQGFGVAFQAEDRLPSGGYEVSHQDNVFVVDGDDAIPLFWRRTVTPVEMAHDLEQLIPED